MARDIVIKGMDRLDAALKRRAAAMQAAAQAAVAAEVNAVQADAARMAPIDTGELRRGIDGKADGTYGQVRTGARHSSFVEFGTSSMAAQPYMAPAADASRRRFTGRVAVGIRRAVA